MILEAVGRKVLETSRAASLCFVLGPGRTGDSADGSNAPLVFDRIDAIVRVGEMSASSHAIERLVQNLPGLMQSGRQQVLINNAPRYAELSWSSSWLKHLAVFPLSRERELFGSLLAINCRDEGDFTTIDAHLLRTVCDRLSAFLANHHLFQDLADLLMGLLHSMVNSIDAKDAYTAGHSERVAHISRILAQSIGLGSEECNRVYLAGLLHDVGKIGVADSILCKPGKLTTEEFDALKKHPEIGKKILSPVRQIQDLLPGVLHHHERMDGNGYPHKLAGEDIPLLGRLICLADCFDAMTTSRTYRAALELPEAIAEIRRCAGTQFDPRLAEVFLKLDLPEVMRVAQAGTKQDPLGACNFGSDWAARIVADQVDA